MNLDIRLGRCVDWTAPPVCMHEQVNRAVVVSDVEHVAQNGGFRSPGTIHSIGPGDTLVCLQVQSPESSVPSCGIDEPVLDHGFTAQRPRRETPPRASALERFDKDLRTLIHPMGDKLLRLKLRRAVARLLRLGGHTSKNAAIDHNIAEHPTIKAPFKKAKFTVAEID